MATYYLKQKNSDITNGFDFDKELSADTETAGSITVTAAAQETRNNIGVTKKWKPNNADWQTGGVTIKVKVTTANSNISLSITAIRISATGSILQQSSQTAGQTLSATGVYTFNVASTDWTAGNCDDRIRITYHFKNNATHGAAQSVTIETGTVDTEVTPANLTENAGTCRATFIKNLRQYKPDHKTIIAEGGSTGGDGVTNNIYLDSLIASRDNADKLTHKIEREVVGTAFDNVANETARQILYDPSSPKIRRSASIVYDSIHKRYLLFGGWNGASPRYNDLWELSADQKFGSSPPQWRKLNPSGTPPSARTTHIAVFDAAGSRMIVHGGYDGADLNDTFALDVTTRYSEAWSTLSPTGTAPAARSEAAGAYKASSRKMYVQGGLVGAGDYRNDLFELDLTTTNGAWTQLKAEDAAGNPPSRNGHTMVFDITNNRLLIFGGFDGTNRLNDLWRWDVAGASFAEISLVSKPGLRQMHVAVYDDANPRMVVFGGRNGTGSSNILRDIWELNTTSGSEAWTSRVLPLGEESAGARSAAACFNSDDKLMCIMGGEDSALAQNKHVNFIDLATSGSTPMYGASFNNWLWGRDAMGYAYNPDRDETLIFGGFARLVEDTLAEGEHVNEFWIYDHANSEWYQPILNSQFGMFEREGPTVIYDTNRDRYIIFGGLTGNNTLNNTYLNDVWELKASAVGALGVYTLTKLNPTGTKPAARWLHAAVYDAVNDRMIVFGGDDGSNFLNDVKALTFGASADGAWSAITPTGTAPSARRQPAYAIDIGENVMLISHGATGVNAFAGDTFKLTLTLGSEAWASVTGTGAPSARRGMTAVYRSTDDAFYFYGGYNGTANFDELWKLTFGASPAWSEISDTGPPAARRSHSGTFSTVGGKMLIYGGRNSTEISFNTLNETWEYDIAGNTWTKKDPKIYIRGGDDVTSLASSTSYHWQSWVSGISGGDSDKVSAFGNLESVADFLTGAGQAFTQTLSEIVAVVDSVPKQAQKAANEVLLIVDSLTRSASRAFSEVVAIADSISNQAQKTFSEIVSVADSLIRQAQKNLAEVVAIVDTLLKQSTLFRTFSEIVTIADSLAKQIARLFGEAVVITDTIARQAIKTFAESVLVADSLIRQTSRTFAEAINITDALAKQTVKTFSEAIVVADSLTAKITAKIFEEIVTITDSLQRTTSRTFNEAVAIIDTKVLQPIKSFVEAVIVADVLSVVLTIKKELLEAILMVDSALKTIGKFMSPEIVLVADSAARLNGKNLQDTIIVADSIAKESRRNILESVLVADTSIRQGIKTFGEALTLADSFLRTWTVQRVFEEIVAIADSVFKQAQRAFSEAVVIADSIAKMPSKIFSEIVAVADAIGKQTGRILNEVVLIADSTTRTAGKLLSDAIAIADSLTRSIQRSFAEAIAIADSLLRQAQKVAQEVVTIVDTIANQLTASRTFAEVVTIADTILKQVGRSFAEVVALADSIIRSPQKVFAEAVTIADSVLKTAQRAFSEAIIVADALAKQSIKAFSESVIVADTAQAIKTFVRDLAEVVAVIDSIAKQTGRSLTEVVLIADSAIRSSGKLASEAIIVADSAIRQTARTMSEIVTIADNLARQAGKVLADAVAIVDSLTAKITAKILLEVVTIADAAEKQVARVFNEIIAIADSVIRQAGKVLSDAVIIADSFARLITAQRILSEATLIADTAAKRIEKTFADAVLIADSLVRSAGRTLTEAVILADSIIRQTARAFAEAVIIADIASNQAQKTFGEIVSIIDSLNRQTARAFSEAVLIADSAFKTAQKTFQEIAVIADSLIKVSSKALNEVVALADSALKQSARTLNEIIAIADSVLKQGIKTFAEAVLLADSIIRQSSKNLLEAIIIADAVFLQKFEIVLSEIVAIADTIARVPQKIVQETVIIADAIGRITSRTFAEIVAIADAVQKRAERAFAEIVAVADSAKAAAQKLLKEAMNITDTAFKSLARTYQEIIAIADSSLKTITRAFAEAVSVVDSFAKLLTRYANLGEVVQIADSISRAITRAFQEIVRIAEAWDVRRLLPPGIRVAIELLTAKIGILLMSAKSWIDLRKESRPMELKSAKHDVGIKSAQTGVEVKGAQQDITLHGQH